ncbi:MAG: hypothetical protein QOF87_2144, partial [Pseudonocardiales bacterium]|nr:hypothetical protein [Pseudonocardiales bacterium]
MVRFLRLAGPANLPSTPYLRIAFNYSASWALEERPGVGLVAVWGLLWVEPGWGFPVGDAVEHVAGPAQLGVFAVMEPADECAVVDAGFSGGGVVGDVVGLT